ncbi:MAG: ATP-dependent DNA helicase RecG [Candidatus Paceibacterota bacterium]
MTPTDLISQRFRLKDDQKKALTRLGLQTLSDLLFYFPHRYQHQGENKEIKDLVAGDTATVIGQVIKAETGKAFRQKTPLGKVTIKDDTGRIKALWFHQPYLAKKLAVGDVVCLAGKVSERNGEPALINPSLSNADYAKRGASLFNDGQNPSLDPIYPETKGINSGWFNYHIRQLLADKIHEKITDSLPTEMIKKYHLPILKTALVWIHQPKKVGDAEAARKRFAFTEVFLIQLARSQARQNYRQAKSPAISLRQKDITDFLQRLPFKPTKAQKKVIADIATDLKKDEPMMRLLEGDVGSGKTAVAAATAYAVVLAGFEVSYMAPTEILAKQHFESFIAYFAHKNIQVGLITGSECRKFPSKVNQEEHTHISRPQLLKWVADGQIPILVGTHSLIQKSVKFKDLGYAIIDEQHRFGVKQRAALVKKGSGRAPHLLSMTATPIPRTLALTVYGDLDLSLLDEMPAGRQPVITKIVTADKREAMYEEIRQKLQTGKQAFVICPRIDEPDPGKARALQAKSARTEAKRLADRIFPEFPVGLVHGKLKPSEKETAMKDFATGRTKILVATSVVEVGVNVPEATIIIIEGAERFGLAQLHQLRGRVMRSTDQAYCYILSDSQATTSLKRLKALTEAKNGFELAEWDLSLRGPGALAAGKQWGISDLGMEAIKNLKMVTAARTEATAIITTDPELTKHPTLLKLLETANREIHFE